MRVNDLDKLAAKRNTDQFSLVFLYSAVAIVVVLTSLLASLLRTVVANTRLRGEPNAAV